MALRYALLGLLAKNDATGYELNQQFKETMIYFWSAHHTQIYRELLKMEENGLTLSKHVHQVEAPDKKIYSITDKGYEALLVWLLEQPSVMPKLKDEFLLKVSLFQNLPSKKAAEYLKKSREHHLQGLEAMKMWRGMNFPDGRYSKNQLGEYLTSGFGQKYMESWVEWCDWAIQELEKMNGDEAE
ncbi:PadR family transcriptional regulator [Fictibacillus aquaticus]|uniref:PadR family transcriptional regulator n=1 Tax=Fictibacillus aquaticus TaxID=2021314 RepID=A0A235FAM5_9BACL|nr:PadR family transcriptional regulator [Fictibacillus aquaticus]OYD58376.1 PadR family transcriptional regulator [Fictibacillus aquaticus]